MIAAFVGLETLRAADVNVNAPRCWIYNASWNRCLGGDGGQTTGANPAEVTGKRPSRRVQPELA
jgi:hypothetical protein